MLPVAGTGVALFFAFLCGGPAWAQPLPAPHSDPVTGREAFLAVAIAATMLCGVVSFVLQGRVSERTHVALAMLGVFAGGFGLLVLFGGSLYENPIAAVLVLLLLFAMFKFMSQFEGIRKSGPKRPEA